MTNFSARVKVWRVLLPLICLMLLTSSGHAQHVLSVDITNSSGQLFGSSTGLQFVKGALTSVGENGQAPYVVGMVGTLTFTTPKITLGDISHGGTFGSGGSFYVSTGYDIDVSATFVSGTWVAVTLPNGTHNYFLRGRIKGTMFLNGTTYSVQGATLQLSSNTGTGPFNGSQNTSGGVTNVVVVP